jgi:hypothetical protein
MKKLNTIVFGVLCAVAVCGCSGMTHDGKCRLYDAFGNFYSLVSAASSTEKPVISDLINLLRVLSGEKQKRSESAREMQQVKAKLAGFDPDTSPAVLRLTQTSGVS